MILIQLLELINDGNYIRQDGTMAEAKKQGYNDKDDEAIGAKDGAEKDKKVSMKGRRDMSRGMEKAMGKRPDSTDSKMDEDQVEEYGKRPMYDEDDVKPMKEESSKMKKSELKAKIKETILAELSLAESGFEASEAGSQYHAFIIYMKQKKM